MEIPNVVAQHYGFYLPVALVIVCAILVFAFGFRSSVEPPSFKQLSFSSDERKAIKKKKLKDKKAPSNGHATVLIEDVDSKKTDQSKTLKQSNKVENVKVKKSEEGEKVKEKKQEVQKSPTKKGDKKTGKENQVEAKNKKNAKANEDKPSDFDEGEWETAFSRKDKKNRKKDDDILAVITPEKTPKKKVNESPKKEIVNEKLQATEILIVKEEPKPETPVKEEPAPPAPVTVEKTEVKETKDETLDDQSGKKKKSKKGKTAEKAEEEGDVVVEAPKPAETKPKVSPAPKPQIEEPKESEVEKESEVVSGAVFDELGDVWKDAPQKKSKKKVRKD